MNQSIVLSINIIYIGRYITQIITFMASDTITSHSDIWKLQLVTTIQHYYPLPSNDKTVILKHALVYLHNFDMNIHSYSSLYT